MPNVNVTYEEMRNAGQQLVAGQQDIESRLTQLKNQIESLVSGGYVTDQSSQAFQSSYEQFDKGARQCMDGLHGMSQYLHKAADTFQQTDQSLASQIGG